jgi:cation:H+ antiporter
MLPAPSHLSFPAALALFAASVALSVGAGFLLARSLDRVGVRLRITDGLLGILTALGADAPEIATAVAAVVAGHSDLGVGVVLGSNVFNLAALLGLSAVIAGGMRIGRRAVALEGTVAIAIAAVAVLVVTGVLPAWGGALAAVAMLVPYVWLISLRPRTIAGEPATGVRARLAVAVAEEESAAHPDHYARPANRRDALLILPALAAVIAASAASVDAAQGVGHHLGISQVVMGTLVLAVLTSVPNAVAAVRLALHRRGSAVVSEAFNSNSANVVAGLCIPAAIVGLDSGGAGRLTAWWALAMTLLAVGLLHHGRGLRPAAGWLVIASYAAFVALVAR